ncbi:23S rRNA pseudouridine(1911/1915/1917) synthase RluD [Halomonas sp. McH1-25]|uniref:23S rRNA pseudouridine(1911/1915/1917) synthase RluD n=1 Tax=unclassified Halomonas TaxID=2609666 RepID=UPI001EF6035A|nr:MULTISPECIES: 23S rRNA pseudouridine(1911/1915/1917) synthase RluD [unclassified Halomonas]MCG7601907.1 23S rRNA pseudouridine(1911/1915/1917) synthase RluD [Halomonas sp. McH1-25]MCP1343914.1 23S rRNA pseudouridine(1911/1915/1917) synthase RluD [Halomonas sp. FL8]MCP1361886.1 23S rRNA pseudouridine(1911/1915/1917) synthase RluD [Halomonas sp. BBD45]MCP1364840.1 23S rRNA pseudouridine(1911/1915/1917) synthase RluD [Halomonas sp. BBD48]
MSETLHRDECIPDAMVGMRLDQAAAELFSDFSRERIKSWIKQGALTLDGAQARPKDKVYGGERLTLDTVLEAEARWEPQAIDLEIVHEDDDVLVIDKPPGLVVHPAAGNPDGTLLNAVLHHCPQLAAIPRAGIVHRLDKDTSGLMVVAKTLAAQTSLVEQLQARTVSREYDAVVIGVMTAGGTVDAPIGRHPKDRKRQAVTESGKPAITHYRVVERFRGHTHVRCRLETGRTHQIRVHMAHRRFPLIGDALYSGRFKVPAGASETLKEILREFPRQALHARKLAFIHPRHGESVEFRADLPDDLLMLLDYLRVDSEERA